MKSIVPFINDYKEKEGTPLNALKINLDNHNWSEEYPAKAYVTVQLWHTDAFLYINYNVREDHIAALVDSDNGPVHTDSCVETFITFGEEGYYNLEANCIGKILLSHRKSRKENVVYATPEILSAIERFSSLGNQNFDCKKTDNAWELTLRIPSSTFFNHDFEHLSGLKAKANFYKCGDNLPSPHFMSWQPIATPTPDFHRPEFFSDLYFQ